MVRCTTAAATHSHATAARWTRLFHSFHSPGPSGRRFIPPRTTPPATHSHRHDRFEGTIRNRNHRVRNGRRQEEALRPHHRPPLLGVPEAEALTGVPAKIIRAQVRNGLLKARMAGSTTMRIRRADLDAWLDALPAWHA